MAASRPTDILRSLPVGLGLFAADIGSLLDAYDVQLVQVQSGLQTVRSVQVLLQQQSHCRDACALVVARVEALERLVAGVEGFCAQTEKILTRCNECLDKLEANDEATSASRKAVLKAKSMFKGFMRKTSSFLKSMQQQQAPVDPTAELPKAAPSAKEVIEAIEREAKDLVRLARGTNK